MAEKAQDEARGIKNIVEEVTGSENDKVGTRKRGRESSRSLVARTARVFIADCRSSLGTC